MTVPFDQKLAHHSKPSPPAQVGEEARWQWNGWLSLVRLASAFCQPVKNPVGQVDKRPAFARID
jgi:hypothetical protein